MTLNEIALKHGTDKSTSTHGYTLAYEQILKTKDVKRVLEIGIAKGASLKMWREYFPKAKVIGLDNNVKHVLANPDCFQVDQGNLLDMIFLKTKIGKDYDLIIDDGSHKIEDQIVSLTVLFPLLSKTGVYVIEDVQHPERFIQDDFITKFCSRTKAITWRIIPSQANGENMITYEYNK